ncbi:hypothetical protein BCR34DRAFT_578433 [Clohesyomyces aquaticus]|uniref:Uncharacterized protein n=1 Tax=Clohesyomyces aquaticus TaxID=1231657 RepID=A0A1Y1YFI7_9PLEO|nr:hypothetical protein BCR34DRAFT_578433 [Clohesyomyces aquaticus]
MEDMRLSPLTGRLSWHFLQLYMQILLHPRQTVELLVQKRHTVESEEYILCSPDHCEREMERCPSPQTCSFHGTRWTHSLERVSVRARFSTILFIRSSFSYSRRPTDLTSGLPFSGNRCVLVTTKSSLSRRYDPPKFYLRLHCYFSKRRNKSYLLILFL